VRICVCVLGGGVTKVMAHKLGQVLVICYSNNEIKNTWNILRKILSERMRKFFTRSAFLLCDFRFLFFSEGLRGFEFQIFWDVKKSRRVSSFRHFWKASQNTWAVYNFLTPLVFTVLFSTLSPTYLYVNSLLRRK